MPAKCRTAGRRIDLVAGRACARPCWYFAHFLLRLGLVIAFKNDSHVSSLLPICHGSGDLLKCQAKLSARSTQKLAPSRVAGRVRRMIKGGLNKFSRGRGCISARIADGERNGGK